MPDSTPPESPDPAAPRAAAIPSPQAALRSAAAARRRIDLDHVILVALCAGAVLLAARTLGGTPLVTVSFRADAVGNVANVFAPLVVIAMLIERAVEVVVGGWREPGAQECAADVKRAEAAGHAQGAAHDALRRYKMNTMQIAFVLAFTLSLLISMVGVQAVSQFLVLGDLPPAQKAVLRWVDVTVTSLMLAGGANGIHQVVTTLTAYLDATKSRATAAG